MNSPSLPPVRREGTPQPSRPDTSRRWAYVGWNIYFPSDLPALRKRMADAERLAGYAYDPEEAHWYGQQVVDLREAIETLEQADA